MSHEPLPAENVAGAYHAVKDLEAAVARFNALKVATLTYREMESVLLDLQRAVSYTAEQAGFNAIWLSESVHQGFDRIERRS